MRLRLKQQRLLEILKASAISQNHWALRLGLSRGHWSAIVNGKHLYPSAKTRVRMLEVFGLAPDDLFEVESDAAPWADTDFRRAVADRYLVDAELGQGGMGAVYLARDIRHGRTLALKVVSAEAVSGIGSVQLQREIATVAKLWQANILPLYDSGEAAGCPWYVMPWVRTGSLRARLQHRTRLQLPETIRLVRGMAAALQHAHQGHVLHCDVKPENVLLEGDHAWLMDFGIARKLRSEQLDWSIHGELDLSAGTPAYVSPEQAAGDPNLDARSDVYSLGCLVFEMLSGRPPFEGTSTREIVSRRFIVPPPPLRELATEVPREVERVIEEAMALPRERRPDSAEAFADELERAAASASAWKSAVNRAGMRARRVIRHAGVAAAGTPTGGIMRHVIQWRDVRDAARSLVRSPVLTLCAVGCLGLGLGVTSAIFSAFNRALLTPLPFPEPQQLVSVYRTTPHFNTSPFSAPTFTDLASATRRLSQVAAVGTTSLLLALPDGGLRLPVARVTGRFFPVLEVRAERGRLLQPSDDEPGAAPAVVITHDLWRDRFGSDSGLVGRTLRLGGESYHVVGIAPAGLRVPLGERFLQADAYVPMRFTPGEMQERRSNAFMAIGRLAPGVTAQAADAELRTLFDGIAAAHPEVHGEQVRVTPILRVADDAVSSPLALVLGAAFCVLLIAASNVASLLLGRGVHRQREMAVRVALGARRWDVVRPVLVESLLLAGLGAAVGLGLALLGVRTIGRLAGQSMPQVSGLSIDPRVFGVACVLAALVALVCGAFPASAAAAVDPEEALRAGARGGVGRKGMGILRGLVVAEVALSLVLLLGAALVMKGMLGLLRRDPGFDPAGLLTMEATISPERYTDGATVQGFLEPALAALQAVPGARSAAAISAIPYDNWGINFNVRYEGVPGDDPTRLPVAEVRIISPSFFGVTGQRLLRGRRLTDADDDRPGTPMAVVVNEALVQRDFARRDPIGRRLHVSDTSYATIVGVVSDIRNVGPVRPPEPEVYFSWRQASTGVTTFPIMMRVAGDPAGFAPRVVAALRDVDPGVAVARLAPMERVISDSVGRPRFYLALLAVFAVIAVVLSTAGLYGVVSYAVAQRTREIGIRTALGSTPLETMRLVVRGGAALVGTGMAIGALAGMALTRLLESLLYGVSPLDPLIWVLVAAGLALTGIMATLVPSWRASVVDPLIAIRTE